MKTISTHYIDGASVESHGEEVMDIINPTNAKVIGRVTLGDEVDTQRAIEAARRAFANFGRTTNMANAGSRRISKPAPYLRFKTALSQ
jgi:aldehyde dehydrogenase (NAD+)